jgi:nucleotide-binding universal stress UspA family protein
VEGAETVHDIQFKKILCPVDFSKYSDYALDYAVELAQLFDGDLRLLHVVEVPFLPSYAMAGVPDLSIPIEQIEEGAQEGMQQLLAKVRGRWERTESEVRTGTAFVEIINYAREAEIDLIVIGTHGRSGLRHMIIGSVAEKIVRKAPCPVLTVKHPEHEFAMP